MSQKKINAKLAEYRVIVQALVLKDFDILSKVPEKIINALKEKEEHPYLQAYVLCHPGEFRPEIVGEKPVPIVWDSEAVKSYEKINVIGKKLFYGHKTREIMGEIVYGLMENDQYIIIAHHPQNKIEAASKCDICSQEAIWDTFEVDGKLYADKVTKLLGVAIEESKHEAPAFSGASKIAQVYATEATEEKKTMPITLGEIKQGIIDLNVQPYQVFDIEAIKSDVRLGPEFVKLETENETLKKSVEDKDTKIKELSESKTEIEKTIAKSTAQGRLDKLVKDKKCTDKQIDFLNKRFAKSELEDYSDDGLSSYVDSTLDLFKDLSGVISESDTEETPPNEQGDDSSYVPTDFDPDNL